MLIFIIYLCDLTTMTILCSDKNSSKVTTLYQTGQFGFDVECEFELSEHNNDYNNSKVMLPESCSVVLAMKAETGKNVFRYNGKKDQNYSGMSPYGAKN